MLILLSDDDNQPIKPSLDDDDPLCDFIMDPTNTEAHPNILKIRDDADIGLNSQETTL